MSDMNGRGGYAQQDPNHILNECSALERDVNNFELNRERFEQLQRRALDDTLVNDKIQSIRNVEKATDEVYNTETAFVGRMIIIKKDPRAGERRNQPTVERVERRLKEVKFKYMNSTSQYQNRMREDSLRQAAIINPGATKEELEAFVADPNVPQFAQSVGPLPTYNFKADDL